MYPTNMMKIVEAVSFSMMGQRRRRWPNIEIAWLNVLCKCLLGPSKKRISPMNCLSRFSRRQRMEAEYYKDISTWLYLHRYRSRDTDTWWCTTLGFLGRWEDCIVFLQNCRNMMQSSQQTRGIHPILFQCWASDGDAGQHWNSIGWMPCVALFAGGCHCVEA